MPNTSTLLKSAVIRAGAGTGKTTTLVNQVFDIYQAYKKEKAKEPAVVLTTFSRKATEELRERLLEIASSKKDYEFLTYLSSEKILITSIDGLCFKFLTKNATSIGYPLMISIMDDNELKKIIKLYLSSSVNNNKKYLPLLNTFSFEELFNLMQQFYIAKLSNPKLSVVTKAIQGVVYLKKAKQLLEVQKNLLLKALDNSSLSEKFSTFYQGHLDFIDHVLSLPDKDKFIQLVDLLKKVKKEVATVTFFKSSGANKEIHDVIKNSIKEFQSIFLAEDFSGNTLLWDLNEKLHLCLEDLLKAVYKQVEVYKKTEGKVSLSDLLLLTLKIINQHPNLGLEFSKKWEYWLVDEYQDTSFAQEKVLKALMGKATSTIVGDPQQSIYFFRGSKKEVFEAKEKEAKLKNQLKYLDINYRSDSSLVYFFNDFFQNFKGNFVKCLPQSKDQKLSNNIFFTSASSKEEELEGIYARIQELKNKGVKAGDIVILAKKADSLKTCALFFKKKELPFYYHGEGSFFKLNEIQDLQALLRFLIIPEDNINFMHLLRSPWFAVEDQVLVDTIENLKKEDSYYISFFKQHAKYPSLVFLSSIVKEFNKLGVLHALNFFITNSDIMNSALFYDPSGRREANIWKFLVQLVQQSRVSNFNILNSGASKLDLDNLDQEAEASPVFLSNQLQMMTIHKSKGLKFEHVILVGMEGKTRKTTDAGANKLFVVDENYTTWTSPFKKDIQESKAHNMYGQQIMFEQSQLEVEETERVFYVALTRAAKSIYLSWVQEYKTNGGKTAKEKTAKELDKSSWALIADKFLKEQNWNKIDIFNKNTNFQSKKYNILKSHVSTDLNEDINVNEDININEGENTKSPMDKDVSKDFISSTLIAETKGLNATPCFTKEKSLSSSAMANSVIDKKEMRPTLPIFTVSNLMQVLSEQKNNKDLKEKIKVDSEADKIFSMQKSFKNKVEKGIKGTYWHNLLEHFVFLLQNNKEKNAAITELKALYHFSENNTSKTSISENNTSETSISEQQFDDVINFLFEDSKVPFLEIIKNGFIEWEFQFPFFSRYIVEGKIDLWGWDKTQTKDTLWVVDYKFGSSKNTALFFNQLELYGQGLSLKFPNQVIQLALLYPLEGKRVVKTFHGVEEKQRLLAITTDSFHGAGV